MSKDNAHLARLDGQAVSLVLTTSCGVPEIAYLGARLPDSLPLDDVLDLRQHISVPGGLDNAEALNVIPETGTGFSAYPAIVAHREGRTFLSQLRLDTIERHHDRLAVRLIEALGEYAVNLSIRLDPLSDVFTFEVTIENTGDSPLVVDWLSSLTIPLPAAFDQIVLFDGRWANEFQWRQQPLVTGSIRKENRLGRTAHNSFPSMIVGEDGFRWNAGTLIGMHLGWSGNHRLVIDRTRDGRLFAQMGELLQPQEVVLDAGGSYRTPPAYLTHSNKGLNGAMRQQHRFVRNKLLRREWRSIERPVHFNTWEACYFAQTETRTLALVEQAAALGSERFVLDDGWFRGRTSANAGLGDWSVCPIKYPRGLEPVIQAIEDRGMQFGLWIEPEMVNADSDLFRAHPDWVLGEEGRRQPLGRNQYVLDLSKREVFEYLAETIGGLIARYELTYLKWDMNRDLTHATVGGRPGYRRTTGAAYRLLETVSTRHPETEIEICASGGARADYGALRFGSRIWPSDVHDPHARQVLQRSFSLFFPPEVMGAHIGNRVDEITGRRHSMSFRCASAIVGHFGVESDPQALDDEETATLRSAIAFYKANRKWLHDAESFFVDHAEACIVARLQVAADRRRALLVVAQLDVCTHAVPAPLTLKGLDPLVTYDVAQLDPTDYTRRSTMSAAGSALEAIGLQLPLGHPDSAQLYLFEAPERTS